MKKIILLILAGVLALSLVACATSNDDTTKAPNENADNSTPKTIKVKTLNASGNEVEITVPYNPKKLAVLDFAVLDMIDSWGLGNRVIGIPKSNAPSYLKSYESNSKIKNFGTPVQADLEAIMYAEPDIIFIGTRLASVYDELSKIAPVVYIKTDATIGVLNSISKNAKNIGSIFGVEYKVETQLADFSERIEPLKALAEDKTALIGMVTSGGFNVIADGTRCSVIGGEIGFLNLGNKKTDGSEPTHGYETTFEFIVAANADWIFVLDRDAAIGTNGAKLAKEVMNNELVNSTSAAKNNQIVYLTPDVWYLADGGIQGLDIMLSDLEAVLIK